MTMLLSSLNSQMTAGTAKARSGESFALNAEAGAPEWVMLWPTGRLIVGRDKRAFTISDPEAIIAATQPRLPLLVDYEHDYEFRKPGDETPAAGWIEELQVRDGAIWGRVAWAAKAMNAIAGREYRFLSPVFLYREGTDPMQVAALDGAGLTHRPNLDLVALNNQQDTTMDKDLLKALGLPETADLATAINAAQSLATPSPQRFVPRADYDQALERATNAEKRIAEIERTQNAAAAEALVDKGIADRKIAPASREHYLKLAVNSRADVEALLAATPAIIPAGEDKGLASADPAKGEGTLTDSQRAICAQLDLPEDAFRKALA